MKRLIDEKGRLFGKISVIDFTIICLLVVVAIGAYVKFFVLEQTAVTVEDSPVHYTLEITNVRDWAMHNIREGDAVFVTGTYVGTVTGVTYGPHEVIVPSDGTVWTAYLPDRYVVWVDIEARATVDGNGRIMVSRTVPTAVGNSPTTFTSRYAEFSAVVREIDLHD